MPIRLRSARAERRGDPFLRLPRPLQRHFGSHAPGGACVFAVKSLGSHSEPNALSQGLFQGFACLISSPTLKASASLWPNA
jgi:hypothetical protein